MGEPPTKVLYGDSTPAELPPDILDVLVRLVDCAARVAKAFQQSVALDRQEEEGSTSTDAILAELDQFQNRAEAALAAAVENARRPELNEHGAEVIHQVVRMVDGWRRQYLGNLEQARGLITRRKAELMDDMREAIESYALPMRTRGDAVTVQRVLEGAGYRDELGYELVEGVRLRLAVTDAEPEVPRRIRTLLGKGAKLQIGVKLSRLRKLEEPAVLSIDDQVVLEAKVEPKRVLLVLAKKPGVPQTIRLELAPMADGTMAGRGTRPDGVSALLPITDAETIGALFDAMQREAERIAAAPARLLSLTLDKSEIDGPEALLQAVERIVDHYRPVVAAIADRSPNVEELAIKHETPDGRREEVWIKRTELGRRFAELPPALRRRVDIAQLRVPVTAPDAHGVPQAIDHADAGENSRRIAVGPPPVPRSGVPSQPVATEDISLLDLEMLVEEISEASSAEACDEPPKVRSRGGR